MAVDQAGLVARVLLYLNVTIGGETPSTEDDATVDLAIAEIMAELEEKKLAYWAVSAIPESVARGMTIMVGANCATSFMSLGESPIHCCQTLWRSPDTRNHRAGI